MNLHKYLAKQFAAPHGLGGSIVSFIMNRQNLPMYEETIRMLSLSEPESVLDIGCGNGYVLNMIAKRYSGSFTGIDISESIIQTAKRRNSAFVKSGKMNFACQDISGMAFEDGSFSRVYTINAVYFWDNLENAMLEISRILRPKGTFINTLYTNEALDRFPHTKHGYKRFTEQQLTDAGTKAGFEVEIKAILNGTALCCIYRITP